MKGFIYKSLSNIDLGIPVTEIGMSAVCGPSAQFCHDFYFCTFVCLCVSPK